MSFRQAHFLFFILAVAALSLILFLLLWRTDRLPFASKTFHSAASHFSFQYPAAWSSTCCRLDGPVSPAAEFVISIADPATVSTASGAPFDGFTIYIDPDASHKPFQNYIIHEQDDEYAVRLGLGYRTLPIDARAALSPQMGRTSDFLLGGRQGVRLDNFIADDISRIFIPLPQDRGIMILAVRLGVHPEWDAQLQKIFASFRFE